MVFRLQPPTLPQVVKKYTDSVYAMVSRLLPLHPLSQVVKKHSVYAKISTEVCMVCGPGCILRLTKSSEMEFGGVDVNSRQPLSLSCY